MGDYMKKGKLKIKNCIIFLVVIVLVVYLIISFVKRMTNSKKEEEKLVNLTTYTVDQVREYFKEKEVKVNMIYEYNYDYDKDKIISQSVKEGTNISDIKTIDIIVSKGGLENDVLVSKNVNELGYVPIMMYHGIHNVSSSSTAYTGGNVDKDGYNRTAEAFRNDLEKYYSLGYRMIRLVDYVNGDIDVALGYSPIVH